MELADEAGIAPAMVFTTADFESVSSSMPDLIPSGKFQLARLRGSFGEAASAHRSNSWAGAGGESWACSTSPKGSICLASSPDALVRLALQSDMARKKQRLGPSVRRNG